MSYFVIKLNDDQYLGAKRNQSVDDIAKARCYKTLVGALRSAEGFRCVPYYQVSVARRISVYGELGGHWFKEEPVSQSLINAKYCQQHGVKT